MEKISIDKADNLAVYEASYIFLPSLAPEQVPAKVESLKNSITSAGGEMISSEDAILIDLAYPMTKIVQTVRHKVNKGYFGWMKFEISRDGIEKIKKSLDANLDVVRYIIIKTVRENTLLNGKMKIQKEERASREESRDESREEEVAPEAPVATPPEELDKSIDELVIV